MIFKSQNPLSPKVTIEIDGVAVNYKSIHSISINLEENKHDVAVITLNGIPPKAITDYVDAAVYITATIGPGRSTEFCGYVTYVEPESASYGSVINNSVFQKARVVCFGSSVVMKNTTTRIWENASTLSISTDLANKYSLSLETIKDSFVLSRLVQTKQSDWEFLTKFCKKYGYSVTVHGSHMRLWDINKAIGRKQSFEVLSTPKSVNSLQPGSILNFNGTFGHLTPEGKSYNYTIESIDINGQILKTVGKPGSDRLSWSGISNQTRYNVALIESSNSVAESEKMVEAKFKEALPFNAVVKTAPTLGTIPGGVVYVEGYDSNFEGFWYVRSVEHEIVGSNCTSTLRISKDFNTSNDAVYSPSESPQIPPPPQFVSRTWRASVERVSIYV